MSERAIEKLKAEINSNKNNSYIQVVGEFLLQYLQLNNNDVEKIMHGGKSIGASLTEMKKVAEKKKTGGCAVLTDQEGFEIVLKYFGIDSAITNTVSKVQEPAVEPPVIKQKKSEIEFNVELDF